MFLYNQMVNMAVTKAFTQVYRHWLTLYGAVKIYEMPLSAEEQALFDKSVKTLEDTFDSIKYLLED